MISRIKQVLCLLSFFVVLIGTSLDQNTEEISEITFESKTETVSGTRPVIKMRTLECYELTEEDLLEEAKLGDMELIAQLVQAEAGNQDLLGKRYVVDVVLNRVDSNEFPNSVEEVIYQNNQFSVIKNGAFDQAAWEISDECFEAVRLEYEERLNRDVLYFSQGKSKYMDDGSFKCQDHWFGW